MNLKKILIISKTILLILTFCFISVAYASEVAGVLNSAGVDAQLVITQGGGSAIIVNAGGGGSGIVSSIASNGNTPSPVSESVTYIDQGALLPPSSSGINYISQPTKSIASLDKTTGGIIEKETLGIIKTVNAQDNISNENTNQLAAAVASGANFGAWPWWILLLLILILIAYYTYKRYERNKKNRANIK